MRVPRTALIVGNGLALSFRAHVYPALEAYDPSDPLRWCDSSGRRLLDHFPQFASAIDATPTTNSAFVRIEQVAARVARGPSIVATELRHFLALAYSAFDRQVAQTPTAKWLTWDWSEYLEAIRLSLDFVVSFNYDLIIERALDEIGVRYRRLGLNEEREGVQILKPHGSIDFEAAGLSLAPTWPSTASADLVDAPVTRLGVEDRERPRQNPELVPPSQSSRIAGFQWVRPGFDAFRAVAGSLDQCIIVGHSYAPVDRLEIDQLLGNLSPRTRLVIGNRTPPDDLVKAAHERDLEVALWRSGPDFSGLVRPPINIGALNRRRRSAPSRLDIPPAVRPRRVGPAGAVFGEDSSGTIRNSQISGFDTAVERLAGAQVTLENVTIKLPQSE